MSSFAARSLLFVSIVAFALAGCGGSNAPVAPTQGPGAGSDAVASSGSQTVSAALSSTPTTYALPLSGGYKATLSLHSNNVPAGTKIQLGVQQPQVATVSRMHNSHRTSNCPTTLTIPLFNPFGFPITLNVDGFSLSLPCTVDGALFGVSFYQVQPAPAVASSIKVGDITASGHSIVFTSTVATITLPPRTETVLAIIPEGSTSEVGIPLSLSGGAAMLTSNAWDFPSPPPSLTLSYTSGGGTGTGTGTLFSSGCDPAYPDPSHPNAIASPLAGVPILGVPQYYCTLGTVNSTSVTFGTSATFTIASPLPDRSFVGLDGPAGEYVCNSPSGSTTTCPTLTSFTVPTVQNVIVGNVQDLQICLPASGGNCNSTGNTGVPAPSTTAAPTYGEVDVLVADDPTYVSNPTSTCAAPAICGGFVLTTSGSCAIDNGSDENGDVPPGYTDPGGPQESPKATTPTSASAFFPAVGPFAEFDVFTYGAGTCSIIVSEHDGPAVPLRSATLNLSVGASTSSGVRVRSQH